MTAVARTALHRIGVKVAGVQVADLALDGLALASIYFLAAIGLAITFGVMGVINMAHGEFITMGADTSYLVQQYIADYTLSIVIALPLAFAVTFAAGVAMERLVIRHLYKRPLETLLATFGISIALQLMVKNIFGTQARPLTAPGWLDGALSVNDMLSINSNPHCDLCAGGAGRAVSPVSDETVAAGAGSACGDTKPRDGGLDGDQPRLDHQADLWPRRRHCRNRRGGHRAGCQGDVRAWYRLHRASFMTVVGGGFGAAVRLVGVSQPGHRGLLVYPDPGDDVGAGPLSVSK